MKKNALILVVIVLIGIISIIFFNANDEDYYLKYANKIVDLYDGKKDPDGIKNKDLEAFDNFYKKLTHQDEMVDITEYFEFTEAHRNSGEPSLKATYTNNKCFIKYDDLMLWDNYDNAPQGDPIFQRVSCNGYEALLFETMFMPPYDRIVENPKYNYVIDSYSDSISGYTFKYKSTYDDSDLTIKLIMEGNKIIEVTVSYD